MIQRERGYFHNNLLKINTTTQVKDSIERSLNFFVAFYEKSDFDCGAQMLYSQDKANRLSEGQLIIEHDINCV